MSYEDLYWEIDSDIRSKGLKKEFDAQLKKMDSQDKHRYLDTRSRWDYAYQKVIKLHAKKSKQK
jgi:hypothetical protein